MAMTITRLTGGQGGNTSQTTFDTASVSPAVGSTVVILISARSFDALATTTDTITCSGLGGSWTDHHNAPATTATYMRTAMFSCVAASTGVISLGSTTARAFRNWQHTVLEIAADGTVSIIQYAVQSAETGTVTIALAAFAGAGNYAVLGAFLNGAGSDTVWTPEADWTALVDSSERVDYSGYKTSSDTSPTCTFTPIDGPSWGVGFEIQETAVGPTIDTQPTAQTAVVNTPAFNPLTFTVAATTSGGTLVYDWELEDGVASGVYANLANGSGATWTGQTAASCTCTVTATTLTGRRIRCNVTDDNGTTTTNAVALTIKTGPVLVQPAVTNASGVTTGTVKSDFPLDASPATAGSVLQLTATAGGVSESICVMPETP